jgi:hypothetical protein
MDLPSSAAARRILRSINTQQSRNPESAPSFTGSPVKDALLLAGLYPHYRLPEFSSDASSLAYLLSTLCREAKAGENTEIVDQTKIFLNHLKEAASSTWTVQKKEKASVKKSLENVKELVVAQGEEGDWVQAIQATL